ncbi:MAG: hypothetical protein HQL05_00615 [Nitrospirae bacterium]|uniref:phage antirepressor N-terminal domain-containing protein n=1 Tax=Candidatus Magnetobacterium casense TaxID=1455061 RepID=UPI0009DDCBF7|nr:hypothetical protein [Nitrospirota bacterium]
MNVQNNLPAITQVNFHEDTLTAIEQDGNVYVAMKPIVESLGLNWEAQIIRVKRYPYHLVGLYKLVPGIGSGS